jgi:hypothetical protein
MAKGYIETARIPAIAARILAIAIAQIILETQHLQSTVLDQH